MKVTRDTYAINEKDKARCVVSGWALVLVKEPFPGRSWRSLWASSRWPQVHSRGSPRFEKLDDAVEWERQAPVPAVAWLQSRRGKANIVGFFEALAPLKVTRFEPHTIFDGGDKVFVLIAFEATNGGENYSFPNNGHLWQFNSAGKVVRYDHITDTAQMISMARAE